MRFRNLLLVSALLAAAPALAFAAPKVGDWGYDASAMDRGVKPGDDFFAYVNGSWLKRTEIAPDRTFAGIDSILNDQIDKDVRDIIQDAAKNPAASGKIGQQVGDFYASWMDQGGVEARGLAPAEPYLDRIAAVHDRGGLMDLFGTVGYTSPVPLFIESDPKNPARYAVFATQNGLGMPNRDYYLLEGAKYDAFRSAYRDYVTNGPRRSAATSRRPTTRRLAPSSPGWCRRCSGRESCRSRSSARSKRSSSASRALSRASESSSAHSRLRLGRII
jgi:endothelin-converting enzyme/putative endopeptidase